MIVSKVTARYVAVAVAMMAGGAMAQDAAPQGPVAGPVAGPAAAAPAGADLALQLSNPLASLISVPMQQNFDFGLGADGDGWTSKTNIQPVIPMSVSKDWLVISRTILPIIGQDGVSAPGASQFGLGDVVQSLFFSPKKSGGVIWGVGPVFLLPTATDDLLGGGKWGGGPTAVVLSQSASGVTVGMLANHIWSFAGSSTRNDISTTFIQPFLSLTTPKATTYGINLESSYDWKRESWLVPANLSVSQLVRLGKQPAQIGGGVRYYLASPDGGPDWGFRLNFTLLFPA